MTRELGNARLVSVNAFGHTILGFSTAPTPSPPTIWSISGRPGRAPFANRTSRRSPPPEGGGHADGSGPAPDCHDHQRSTQCDEDDPRRKPSELGRISDGGGAVMPPPRR